MSLFSCGSRARYKTCGKYTESVILVLYVTDNICIVWEDCG